MPNQSAEHTELVKAALEALALKGISAWPNQTGVWFERGVKDIKGRPHKFGKKGSADIFAIIPVLGTIKGKSKKVGMHCEFEAKTGKASQNENQEKHQEFVVEKNGGLYIIFRSVDELFEEIQDRLWI